MMSLLLLRQKQVHFFQNAKTTIPIQRQRIALGRPQPPTPIKNNEWFSPQQQH